MPSSASSQGVAQKRWISTQKKLISKTPSVLLILGRVQTNDTEMMQKIDENDPSRILGKFWGVEILVLQNFFLWDQTERKKETTEAKKKAACPG